MTITTIIAEAGVNHNGDIATAKKLIDVAAEAGADYVKFQTFNAESLVSKAAKKAAYQIKNITDSKDDTQYEMLKKLQLDVSTHRVLIDYCAKKNIKFLSTAFDICSLELLHELEIELFKIPSGEITNLPYLRKIGSYGKPILLSTGMCVMDEIADAIQVLENAGTPKEKITVLHCTTDYPTSMQDVNLRAVVTIKDTLGVKVGYSDHTLGIEVPIAAVALGATVIEKHFTLSRTMEGPDHKASLEPMQLKAMVQAIRNIELAMGSAVKAPTETELMNRKVVRKGIVALAKIKKGDMFTEQNITVKRTSGSFITPMHIEKVLGLLAIKDFEPDETITL